MAAAPIPFPAPLHPPVKLAKPVFEFFRDRNREWRWRLKAANGRIVCQSEGYTSRQAARKGVASVVKNAPKARIVWK